MKIRKLGIYIIFSLLFLSISQTTHAVLPTKKTFCLDAVVCNTNPCSGEGVKGHRVRLSTRTDAKLLPNKQAYIIACTAGDGASLPICTTGNSLNQVPATTSDLDTLPELYGQDNIVAMNALGWGYKFEGLYGADGKTSPNGPGKPANPVMVKSNGEIDILEWQDSTTNGKSRLWQALFLVDPSEGIGATGAGVKQNDLDFDSAGRACVKISWDPWGRVFDSQTLEPVSGAKVSLLYKDTDNIFKELFGLSSTTKNNGKYEIVVEDGEYKLVINPPSLQIATDPATIHSSYVKAYYNLYTGAPIIQAGAIQHRDVAVKTPPPGIVTPLEYNYFIESGSIGMTISGTVTHPLSIVSINTVKSSDIKYDQSGNEITSPPPPYHRKGVATTTADKNGNFSLLINQVNLERTKDYQEVVYDVDITKANLTGGPVTKNESNNFIGVVSKFIFSLFRPVYGATIKANFRIPSIPTYLSGYAYDSVGKPIPNATVGLYLTFSKAPSHIVQADANGFFRVTSNNIPNMPFVIKYTTPTGQVVTTSTSQFIAQNHQTNVENKTSPFEYRDQNNTIITPPIVKPTVVSGGSNSKSGTMPGGTTSTNPISSSGNKANSNPAVTQTLIVLVLLILLLGGVGIGVMLYMKNKTPQTGTF
ncbi:hypothetical protein COY87_05100 [Candidatus Roizmanbacteria bacterium CG_4_10_14_0_8_um_filter_33_9]|uniref:SD-repeat containing protein B domain-containing protein n=1 Tax=Candidatus Roizmanbacteria bacterium CG_4_10_14_0_8_um_filter_33_9 TaxID=1974826 RepID=A0A2M7QI33_9BACT|nr:MAG: hypothetical protein COY87_05100 [Candidatus Roizmanbacteria bacterium CG_4_10_14_0_8_um_filter_33_9]